MILMFSRFIEYLNKAISGGIKPSFLFIIILCRITDFLGIIFPFAFFLSILVVYGRLYEEHEMVILQSCGISPAKLLRYTYSIGLVVLLLTGLFNFWLTPLGMEKTLQLLNLQKSFTATEMIQQGKFESIGNNVYFIKKINKDKNYLKDIFVAHKNPAKGENNISVFIAKKGVIKNENNSRYLVLNNGYRYDVTAGQFGGNITQYDDYGVLIQSKPVETITSEAALPSSELFKMTSPEAIVEWQWRISLLLMVPISILIALPLSGIRPRQGRYSNLPPGVLIYLIYLAMLMTFKAFSLKRPELKFSILYSIDLFFALLGCLLFFKDKLKKLVIAGR